MGGLKKIIFDKRLFFFTVFSISFLMHFPHFTKDLVGIHVWRQTQTQTTIINFYEEDFNILNPRRNNRGDTEGYFRMEFPLMQWTAALFHKLFGNNIAITRIYMFIIGLFSVAGFYFLIHLLSNNKVASAIGAWALTFLPSFYYHTINPLPDNLALCFAIWATVLFVFWQKNKPKISILFFSGIIMCLAVLVKLPYIIYYSLPFFYFSKALIFKENKKQILKQIVLFFLPFIFPIAWYLKVIPQWNDNIVIKGMLGNQFKFNTIVEYLSHNLISTLPELLLNYGALPLFIFGIYYTFKNKVYQNKNFFSIAFLGIVILAYYLYEINAIGKDHDYYHFPFLPLLFILVAYGGINLLKTKFRSFTLFILILLPFTCFLRMKNAWSYERPNFNKDILIHKEELKNIVPDNNLVVVGSDKSHFIYFYHLNKKGWSFSHDYLPDSTLNYMINNGAKYLYSDSRWVDENEKIGHLLEELILEKGSIRVFKLKEM